MAEAWWRRPVGEWGSGQSLLACGAAVVADLRAAVRQELGYSCSAGYLSHISVPPNICSLEEYNTSPVHLLSQSGANRRAEVASAQSGRSESGRQ